MDNKIQRVELTVTNKPGVLDRVIIHIRHEGWNIKRLTAEDIEDGALSHMEMDIEGTHTKLAQVVERLLHLDCVLGISTIIDGEKTVKKRKQKETQGAPLPAAEPKKAPAKKEGTYRILTINPGSTSTKFAVYDDESDIFTQTIRHGQEELSRFGSIIEQKDYRKDCIVSALAEAEIGGETLDAVAGRGGLLRPIESGTYVIGQTMLEDLRTATAAMHASALGAIIASEIAGKFAIPAYVVDPVVVDEMDRYAKLTGMPGIERASVFHALNQKAVARRAARDMGKPYENTRLVVAHLGGGITVGAHRYGRVLDVNDGLAGEGPFTPERTGGIPALPLIRMCFSGDYTEAEMADKVTKKGGLLAYLGTNDLRVVQNMINGGDAFAAMVLDSMGYQVSKEIGAMAAVLEGKVDAILLTGGLAYSNRFTGAVKQRVDSLAPVHVYAGEDEMFALMSGALRVLRGEESAAQYE